MTALKTYLGDLLLFFLIAIIVFFAALLWICCYVGFGVINFIFTLVIEYFNEKDKSNE